MDEGERKRKGRIKEKAVASIGERNCEESVKKSKAMLLLRGVDSNLGGVKEGKGRRMDEEEEVRLVVRQKVMIKEQEVHFYRDA